MLNSPTMKVQWLVNETYHGDGCWCLVLGNNHLFLEAAQKGPHGLTESRLRRMADLWNKSHLQKAVRT